MEQKLMSLTEGLGQTSAMLAEAMKKPADSGKHGARSWDRQRQEREYEACGAAISPRICSTSSPGSSIS